MGIYKWNPSLNGIKLISGKRLMFSFGTQLSILVSAKTM